ncbi:nitrite reductase small subunit NirD [Vibrio tapetis]|uniref:Nitrite reductase, NAD(P)H-binding, small subunit n=1 Tax=Vibrio tapetis subsp. tapetis TaxID=1671868 RepID=A0A2N8ZMC0_9VIBR|nr:nitrite reductase small subunit NirD [Vibrio tapetis]SON53006.1 nitrite reductase, NAD(P)H-binding, small subunit [Vibrio tapetis subsp. tapetis]
MTNWQTVCTKDDLIPHTGVCTKVGDQQIALFYCARTEGLYAISNYDPIGKANVLSRGMMGSITGQPCVASPLYKQHFHLETGICIEDPDLKVETFAVREQGSSIQISLSK